MAIIFPCGIGSTDHSSSNQRDYGGCHHEGKHFLWSLNDAKVKAHPSVDLLRALILLLFPVHVHKWGWPAIMEHVHCWPQDNNTSQAYLWCPLLPSVLIPISYYYGSSLPFAQTAIAVISFLISFFQSESNSRHFILTFQNYSSGMSKSLQWFSIS